MELKRIPTLGEIGKNWLFWLLVITGVAIILRLLPALSNAAWGTDFGIYYGLSNLYVDTGSLYNNFDIWGGEYQNFPILFVITGFVHQITGIDVLTILPYIGPIFGGLTVLIFYFLVNELTNNKKTALLSSLFAAVLPFHVYQTSASQPLVVGIFFMTLSMYFFIKFRQDVRYIIPLFISTALLIMSHHLTTYFCVISLSFIVFLENINQTEWTPSIKKDIVYILALCTSTFLYWILIAPKMYTGFMKLGMGSNYFSSYLVMLLFYLLFFSMFGIIWLKRRLNISINYKKITLSPINKFIIAFLLCLLAVAIFSQIELPWSQLNYSPISILYSLPFFIILAFGISGFARTMHVKNGLFVCGWFLAIGMSFIYGFTAQSMALLPHRHLEYLIFPLSILAIFGIDSVFKSRHDLLSLSKLGIKTKKEILYVFFVGLLVLSNGSFVYSSHLSWVGLDEPYEAITDEDLAILQWADENLDKDTTVIASDHRLNCMALAMGFNTTRDEAKKLWNSTNITECMDDLYGMGKNYSKITHVIIDNIMKERFVLIDFNGLKAYMTNETSNASYDKFKEQPFELVYRTTIPEEDTDESHWTEIFEVNWTYIEKYF